MFLLRCVKNGTIVDWTKCSLLETKIGIRVRLTAKEDQYLLVMKIWLPLLVSYGNRSSKAVR